MSKIVGEEWLKVFNVLNESQRRWVAAIKSLELGYGGISIVSRSTGLSRTTITQGIREVHGNRLQSDSKFVRNPGGGRKTVLSKNGKLQDAIEAILSETTAGDPMSALTWTSKSMRKIALDLQRRGHQVSYKTVNTILHNLGYSLQSNRKSLSRASDTNRDKQFQFINKTVKEFLERRDPVISVDAKKKEQVGNFKNTGSTWRKQGDPTQVEDHDYRSRAKGIAIPYGAYDLRLNEGFVNVGVTKDTAEFAVNSVGQWWQRYGEHQYSDAHNILLCADGGGSNGSCNRLWKYCLQKLANSTGLSIRVCHYPPGTGKWNKIEHKMFSYISINWKGRPLESYEAVINLIANTTTAKGLKINAVLDENVYEKGKKVSSKQFESMNIEFDEKYPKWNYKIQPNL